MTPYHLLLRSAATAALPLALLAQSPRVPSPGHLAQRAAIARQLQGIVPPQTLTSVDGPLLEAALDLPPAVTTAVSQFGNPAQISVRSNLGIINPRAGSDFVLLSTGVAGTSAPEPGTNFGGGGAFGFDTASVTLTLNVPAEATTLTFDYRFFSAEYPDFVSAGFNDTFSTTLNGNTVASISVDSASFYPAFTSIADGTGFDIFAPNPSGVNYVFPGGLPDAGLTDWLSASIAVTPGATVTLVFGIGDFGDGILDSAVLLDNVQFSNLEVLDGDDDGFRQGNDLTNDSNTLAQGGAARVGICADGTARLLLRMNLPGPGMVNFTIQNFVNATESGALGLPGGPPQGGALQVVSVNTPQGHKAFAVYRAPLDFVRPGNPGDLAARTRNLVLQTTFTPQAGAPQQAMKTLLIERPPVVLCHGLWSNPATWNGFAPLVGDARFDFTRADYSNNNAGLFAVNRFQTRTNAVRARNAKKLRGIASAQVDWIGHSMGGVLPRSFAATGFFRRPDNFGAGDLHKMVTVNTPHWGSPMANLLLSIRGTFFVGDLLIVGMERMGMSVVGGAIDNLAEGSAAYAAIGATPVRTHCIAGIGGSQAIGVADIGLAAAAALTPPPYKALFQLLHLVSFATTAAIYRFQDHDFIVLRPSQEGGLGGGAITVFGGLGSTHTAVTSHAPAANQCIALLNAATNGASFASPVPAPNLTPPLTGGDSLPGPTPAQPGQGIQFTTTPSAVTPGQTVAVAVAPFGGFQPTSVLFLASSMTAVSVTSPPFTANLTVPADAVQEFSVIAIAENALREIAVSNPLPFPVNVNATLTGIELFADRLYLQRLGQQAVVSVAGNFSDSVQRLLTGGALGTTYLTNDATVATVSAEGIVTAVGEGVAAIIARHGGFEVSLGVFVELEADVASLGTPCATTVGLPTLGTDDEVPSVGNNEFGFAIGNAPANSLVLISLNLGSPDPLGLPLPGAPSCVRVHVLPIDLIATFASGAGNVWHPLPIPNQTSLAGAVLSTQGFVTDLGLGAFALPLGSTPALDIAIGH